MRAIGPSVLLSIFKRKGGIGINTRIFENGATFSHSQIAYLENEKPLILYFKDEGQWMLITSARVLGKTEETYVAQLHSELKSVSLDLKSLKINLDKLVLADVHNQQYQFVLEPGRPFWGMFTVLGFIARPGF